MIEVDDIQEGDDYPALDTFHASCDASATWVGKKCTDLWPRMFAIVKNYAGNDPANGTYKITDSSPNRYLRTIRTSPCKKFQDDVVFYLQQTPSGCFVQGKSRSRSLSFYDFGTNYCNIWNVIFYTDVPSNYQTTGCRYVPKNPAQTCVVY